MARVSAFQADCCGFESHRPLHFLSELVFYPNESIGDWRNWLAHVLWEHGVASSSLASPTILLFWRYRLVVRTAGFHPVNRSSILRSATIFGSIWRGSSVVEQRPEKPCVGGPIPLLATNHSYQKYTLERVYFYIGDLDEYLYNLIYSIVFSDYYAKRGSISYKNQ